MILAELESHDSQLFKNTKIIENGCILRNLRRILVGASIPIIPLNMQNSINICNNFAQFMTLEKYRYKISSKIALEIDEYRSIFDEIGIIGKPWLSAFQNYQHNRKWIHIKKVTAHLSPSIKCDFANFCKLREVDFILSLLIIIILNFAKFFLCVPIVPICPYFIGAA